MQTLLYIATLTVAFVVAVLVVATGRLSWQIITTDTLQHHYISRVEPLTTARVVECDLLVLDRPSWTGWGGPDRHIHDEVSPLRLSFDSW